MHLASGTLGTYNTYIACLPSVVATAGPDVDCHFFIHCCLLACLLGLLCFTICRYCREEFVPHRRGYQTFTGYVNGAEHYFSHIRDPDRVSFHNFSSGFDFYAAKESRYVSGHFRFTDDRFKIEFATPCHGTCQRLCCLDLHHSLLSCFEYLRVFCSPIGTPSIDWAQNATGPIDNIDPENGGNCYSAHVLAKAAADIVAEHQADPDAPLFMCVAVCFTCHCIDFASQTQSNRIHPTSGLNWSRRSCMCIPVAMPKLCIFSQVSCISIGACTVRGPQSLR